MQSRSRLCGDCTQAKRTNEKGERWQERYPEASPPPAIPRFEPQAAPPDGPWEGRPWNDPRNNYRLPNWNKDIPRRDLVVSPIRVCVFDIEATSLNASFGRVLCAVARFFGPDETKVWRADEYPAWKAGWRSNDEDIVRDILKGLEEADVWIAHNGCNYDAPFMRTRAIIQRLPPVHPKKLWDPCVQARRDFRFASNRLDAINRDLEVGIDKTEVSPAVWASAAMDHDEHGTAAMEYVVEHCLRDVESLCLTARRLAPYNRQLDTWGSFR
jgi:uncharacterized protein YprB with RNaseH-like and TPR domain